MEHDVFISYSSKNYDIAELIFNELEKASVKCWMAPQSLNGGDEYEEIIEKSISACKVFVLVFSEPAVNSRWVNSELTIAFNEYKHIIPFKIDQTLLEGKMRVKLIQSHWIDAYPEAASKVAELVHSVKHVLAESVERRGYEVKEESKSVFGFVHRLDFEDAQKAFENKRYSQAVDLLLPLSISGHRESQELLCQLYYEVSGSSLSSNETGSQVDGDIIRSFNPSIRETIMSIADKGADWANFIMHCYAYKQNNNTLSYECVKKAVLGGTIGVAYLRLGIVYHWGLGVDVNWDHAMACFKEAEELGCHYVYSYLGQMYRWGNAECTPNKLKAIEYYKQGVEKNDKRSISQLMSLYLDERMEEEARDFLVCLSEMNIDDIDFYYGQYFTSLYFKDGASEDRDCAIGYMQIALNHRDYRAYGYLSQLYYGTDDSLARQYAEDGYLHGDAYSYFLLCFMLLHSDDCEQHLERVWTITKERVDRFGVGADTLGMLFLEHHYLPEGETLASLIKYLETNARIGDIDSCRCLIRLFSEEEFGVKNLEKENEYRRQAANLAIANPDIIGEDEVLDYVKFLMENASLLYNPMDVDVYLKPAIERGNVAAAKLFLERYKTAWNGGSSPLTKSNTEASKSLMEKLKAKSDSKFKIWSYENAASYILKNKAYDQSLFSEFIDLQVTNENAKDYQSFLLQAQDWFASEKNGYFCRNKIDTLILKGYLEGLYSIPYVVISSIKERLRIILKEAPGLVLLLKEQIGMLFPSYDKEKGIQEFLEGKDSVDAELFYILSSDNFEHVVNVDIQDCIMNSFLMPIHDDKCFPEILRSENGEIVGDEELWSCPLKDIDECYRKVCEKIGMNPVCNLSRCSFDTIAPFFPSTLISEYRKQSHRALVSVIMHDKTHAPLLDALDDAEKVLNYAEGLTDQDLQLFIIYCVEIEVEADILLIDRYRMMEALVRGDKKPFVEFVQAYIKRIEKAGIQTDLSEAAFNESIQKTFDQWRNGFGAEEEDFEQLLNRFIQSEKSE